MPTLTITSPAVIAAARALNKISATVCNIDEEDSWKHQSDGFKADALAALNAAGVGELVEALTLARNLVGTGGINASERRIIDVCLKTFTGSDS